MESLKNENQRIINKVLIILVIIIGMFFVKSNPVFADASAYYLGSKDATKATGYNVAKNSDGSNIETSLDLTQTLDKIIYYILTYEEYDNKTYIGDSSNLNVEERKQAALYYFIHNYKQEENRYSALTTNERLKNILANYAGNGNNLSEFESYNRNGAQVIYALAESWAKGEDMLQAASKLKVNYIALANDNVKYWASITEYPLEDSIYNPTTEENTLIISVYFPQEIEKTAQNAIKVVDQEIVQAKLDMLRNVINDKVMSIGSLRFNLLGRTADGRGEVGDVEDLILGPGHTGDGEVGIPINYYCIDELAPYYGTNYRCTQIDQQFPYKDNFSAGEDREKYARFEKYLFSSFGGHTIQLALWGYLNGENWGSEIPKEHGGEKDWHNASYNSRQLYNDAKKYAEESISNEVSIEADPNNISAEHVTITFEGENVNATKIGPINIHSESNRWCGITNFTVNDSDVIAYQSISNNNIRKFDKSVFDIPVEGENDDLPAGHYITHSYECTNAENATKLNGNYYIYVNGHISLENVEIYINAAEMTIDGTYEYWDALPATALGERTQDLIRPRCERKLVDNPATLQIELKKCNPYTLNIKKTLEDGGNPSGTKFAVSSAKKNCNINSEDEGLEIVQNTTFSSEIEETIGNSGELSIVNNSALYNQDETNTAVIYKIRETAPLAGYSIPAEAKEIYVLVYILYESDEYTPSAMYLYLKDENGNWTKGNITGVSLTFTGAIGTLNINNVQIIYNFYLRKINKFSSPTENEGGANGAEFEINIAGTALKDASGNNFVTTGGWIKQEGLKAGSTRVSINLKEVTAPNNMKLDNDAEISEINVNFRDRYIIEESNEYDSGRCIVSTYREQTINGVRKENVIIITVKDTPEYNLEIYKVNSEETGQGINGVEFSISDSTGNSFSNTTTQKIDGIDGRVLLQKKGISQGTNFEIKLKEANAPDGVTIEYPNEVTIKINANTIDGSISLVSSAAPNSSYYKVEVTSNPNVVKVYVKDTPYTTPKLKIIKVDSNDHNIKLEDAEFRVEIPNTSAYFLTDSNGEVSNIQLKDIAYGETITGTIQETIAPSGYRVDNKDKVSIRIKYDTSGSGSFSENRVHVSLSGNTKGYSIRNLVPGTDYINGDTIEILVTDTPIQVNLKVIKKDFDKKDATDGYIEGANFLIGSATEAIEATTDANGVIMLNNMSYYTRDDKFEMEPWIYYSGYVANGGGIYDANGWNGGTGIAGRQYDIEKETESFLAAFNNKGNGRKDVVESTQTHENHYTGQTEKNLTVNPTWYNIIIIETGVTEEYHTSPMRLIPLLFLTDDQGCIYAAIGGDTFGKGYVYKVEIIEKYNGDKIEDTIVLTILNSTIYTLNMDKFAKNEGTAGCDLSIPLSGAKYEAVRLMAKEEKNSILKSIGTETATVNINDLTTYNQMMLWQINLETTEEWQTNNGGNTATLKLWHENYRREEEVIIYQIKETTPPEGYQPKNFYLLLNTKNGVINAYIGYEEGGTITFNRTSIENTVDLKNINGKTVNLNVGNKPIKYDLNIHKVDIYADYDIPDVEFQIENISEEGDITKITDAQGNILLENLNVSDIEGTERKIIKLFERTAPQDYKMPENYGANIEVQIKFKFNGRVYDHYRDINWAESADSEWCTDDENYKKVTVIAELLTDVRDDYYDYDLNDEDYNIDGNKKIELTVKDTPIISLNLNKIAANGNTLNETHFRITEYQGEVTEVPSIDEMPTTNYGNLKLFTSGNTTYTTDTSDFVVGNSGTKNIRFLADKKFMLIKIEETSTDEHYSILYDPIYVMIYDGSTVGFYKGNKRDRARLSNEEESFMNRAPFDSYTLGESFCNIWIGSAVRHQFAVEINNLTEMWLDLTKIYTGWKNGAIEGNTKFTVTSNELETIQDTVTISAAEVREQVSGKYFKFRFKDNFERDANEDDTNKTLKATFTVKEESSAYNRGANQFWAEIPEFKFTATFQKDNKGYIWLTDVGEPEAVNSTYTKTINDLYENKYKNNANDRYIDITNKGDRNATIDFKLRNPQVKSFQFSIVKFDQDMNVESCPDQSRMNGIKFSITAKTSKGEYTWDDCTTDTIDLGNGMLKVILDIQNNNFRKNNSNQNANCLLDSSEPIEFYVTEKECENNRYYKFRKKPVTVKIPTTIDTNGYFRIDDNFNTRQHVPSGTGTKAQISVQTEDPTNDITGLGTPSICRVYTNHTAYSIHVPNKRRWIQLQGMVWKDIVSSGKVSSVDGTLNNEEYKAPNGSVIEKEKRIKGITVKLHKIDGNKMFNKYARNIINYSDVSTLNFKANNGALILDRNTDISTTAKINEIINSNEVSYLETLTDDNGNYEFSVPMYNGYYYVEFIYNGYKYQHTKYIPWNGKGIYSNATETEIDRDELNNKFATITNYDEGLRIDSANRDTINNLNLINTETSETTTNYKGINIGISAYTGGFGKQNNDYVKYSATKATDSNEGKVYNSRENTSVPNNTANRNVLDTRHTSVRYDHVYKNINLGITPREAVRLKLTKGVSNVTLSSGKNDGAEQQYNGATYGVYDEINGTITTENNIQLAPNISNVQTLNGNDFYNADNNSQAKYKQYKNAIGEYDLGVRVEDEYAYLDGNTAKANIKYAISLTNNSSEIGVKVNELVDYFDKNFDYDVSKIKVTDINNNPIRYELKNEHKMLETYDTAGNNTGTSKEFHEMHIILENPIELNPFVTRIIYVTFTMDVKDNVVINDGDGVENEESNVRINNVANIQDKIRTNVAEVWSYSTYYVENGINANNTNSYNEHNIGDIAGRVDMQSNPGNVSGIKSTGIATEPYVPYVNEYDDGIAFVRLIELRRRVFSGNVWVENRNITNATTKNAVIGNGIRESGETGLAGVKVQLREYLHNNDGTTTDRIARVFIDERVYAAKNANNEIQNTAIATRYYNTNNSDSHVKWIDAPTIVTTESDFTYSFTGVTTGDYYLLFTYPDGQTYKTTIYNGKVGNGFNINYPDNNTNVICDLDDNNHYSDARDIYGNISTPKTRQYVNNLLSDGEINNNSTANKQIKEDYNTYIAENRNNAIAMDAITGKIQVNFETDRSSYDNNLSQPRREEGSIDWIYSRTFERKNIDLGLVERPKSQLKITNDIANVKLELANGAILFDASQRATNVMWAEATDNNDWYYNEKMIKNPNYKLSGAAAETYNRYENRRRASVLATIDQELMQGATVKIKYKITVTNVGEVDYSDKKFYYRGEEDNPSANVVKTTPLQIVDYVGYQGTDDDKGTRNNLNFAEAYNKDESGNLIWNYKKATNSSDSLKSQGLLSDTAANIANQNYTTIVVHQTNNTINGLAPHIKHVDCSEIPSEYTTEIVLSRVISSSSGTDDLSYNNLVEIINLKNEVGRRTAYSTVGNQNPIKPAAELDADDSGMVIFTIPFGEKQEKYLSSEIIENNDYTIDIVLATAIIVLSALAVTIINKRK